MFSSPQRFLRILFVCAVALVASAAPASATMLVGVESNGEFTNPDRTPAQQIASLDKAKLAGAQIIRANVGWRDIAANCAGRTTAQLADHTNACYNWSVLDTLVRESHRRGIQLVVSVTRAPSWVNGNNDPYYVGASSTQFSRFVANYTSFTTAIGTRYNSHSSIGVISKWTIWSEPNSNTFWKPMSSRTDIANAPIKYAVLYAAAAPALRAANPTALIAPGPTGPKSTIKPVTYMKVLQPQLLRRLPGRTVTIKRRYINAWAHNPYPVLGKAPNVPTLKRPAVGMGNINDLFVQLDAQALTKRLPVWATEFGYETNPPDRIFGIPVSRQGPFLTQALDLLDSRSRVTVAISYQLTDPVDTLDFQSGLFYANGTAKPSLTWFQRPVSVSATSVRRGTKVVVWGRSLVNLRTGRLAYSVNGGRTWFLLPATGRRSDGSQRIAVRMTRTMKFRVQDSTGKGLERAVIAR